MNVYVVLAGNFPMVFANENDAQNYADYSGNGPVHKCAVRSAEDAADLEADYNDGQ